MRNKFSRILPRFMAIAAINITLLILLYWLPNQTKANTTANVILPSITADVLDGEDGNCSLREAVYNANNNTQYGSVTGECPSGSNSQTDVIHLQSGATYTLNLISGSLKLLDNAAVAVDLRLESIDATATIQMATPNERVIEIDGASVAMDNLVVSGGSTAGGGGGILNQGMLTMTRTLVQDNQARHGGGILNQGTAVIHDSQILNNIADLNGAGIANVDGGWLTLDNSQIASNAAGQNGGGLYHIDDQSVLTITNSAILSNTATNGDGGGLYVLADSTINNGRLQNNHAPHSLGGGIYNGSASLRGEQIHIIDNQALLGGGVYHVGTFASLTLTQALIDGNQAQDGAGLYLAPNTTTDLIQAAVVHNEASGMGGGIYLQGQATLGNVTISANSAGGSGGGLAIEATGSAQAVNMTLALNDNNLYQAGAFSLQNSVISAGSSSSCIQISVEISSAGHNLTNDDSCLGLDAVSDIFATDLGLAPLDNYYSDSPTHALLTDSPALNAADLDACLTDPIYGQDQRGYGRPFGVGCDIGAHEEQPAAVLYLPFITK